MDNQNNSPIFGNNSNLNLSVSHVYFAREKCSISQRKCQWQLASVTITPDSFHRLFEAKAFRSGKILLFLYPKEKIDGIKILELHRCGSTTKLSGSHILC
jgi:hypothetical protein